VRLIVYLLARCGRVGDWLLHRLGWLEFHTDTFTHAHAPRCLNPDVRFELRPQGWVKRCATCRYPIEVHYACWEVAGGAMPGEVVKWIAEEIHATANLDASTSDSVLG